MDFTVNNTIHIVLAWLKIISEMGSNCTTTNKQCNLLQNRTESWPNRQEKSAASRYPASFHHAPSSLRARGHLLLPPARNSCLPLIWNTSFFFVFLIFSPALHETTPPFYIAASSSQRSPACCRLASLLLSFSSLLGSGLLPLNFSCSNAFAMRYHYAITSVFFICCRFQFIVSLEI